MLSYLGRLFYDNSPTVPALKPDDALTTDSWQEIISRLDPHSILSVAQVNKYFRPIIRPVFGKKLQEHFPDAFAKHPTSRDFYSLFRKTYQNHYFHLLPAERKWYSLIKEGDIEKMRFLNIEDILVALKNNRENILFFTKQRQHVADFLFAKIHWRFGYSIFGNKNFLESSTYFTFAHWFAVLSPSVELIDELLPGFNPYYFHYPIDHPTPLFWAAKYNQTQACEFLLSRNTDINVGGPRGHCSKQATSLSHWPAIQDVLQSFSN